MRCERSPCWRAHRGAVILSAVAVMASLGSKGPMSVELQTCSLSVRFQRSTTPLVSDSSTKAKLGWMPQ